MVDMDVVALNLTETHKTVQNIKKRKVFTVSIADAKHTIEADYFGVESGKNVADKLSKAGITATKSENVDITKLAAIAYDPFTHGYYKIGERVGTAFSDGLKLK